MSLHDFENSRTKGRPVNLYLIRYGSAAGAYYAYTDAEQPVISGSIEYQPVPVQRGKIAISGTLDKATLEVRMSKSVEAANLFLFHTPAEVVNVIVRQGHINDPDNEFLVGWTGRVVGAKRTDTEVILSCEPIATSMKRVGLRRHYQYSCMHVLYGPHCNADKDNATMEATPTAVSGARLTMPHGWVPPEEVSGYIGGIIEWVNASGSVEMRSIMRIVDGITIVMSHPLPSFPLGSSVNIVKGCARTMDACRGHDNIHNFGGCPFIPKSNPFGTLNQFF